MFFCKYPNIFSVGTTLEEEGGVYDIIKTTLRNLTKFNNLSLNGYGVDGGELQRRRQKGLL